MPTAEEIPVSPIQLFQRPMTQSQEIDGLAEFDPEISSSSLGMGRFMFWQVT